MAIISGKNHTDMSINFENKYLIDVFVIRLLFNRIHDGPFRGNLAYSIMMKLGPVILCLKKIQKVYQSRDTPLLTSAFFAKN